MTIPTDLTELQFRKHIAPHLSKVNRAYVCEQPLYKFFIYMLYQRYTGCPRAAVPIQKGDDGQPVMSYQVPYYHFRKWSKDGSLQGLCDAGIISIKYELNLSVLNLDGSHSVATKGAKASPTRGERRPKLATSCP